MVILKPHILKWVKVDAESTETPEGYPVPNSEGQPIEIPCRFHLAKNGTVKTFKNEDSTIVNQVGTIRVGPGIEVPEVGVSIKVVGMNNVLVYEGTVKAVYEGQLSSRIEV